MDGLRCCKGCDLREWPDKISEKEAMTTYHLTDNDLNLKLIRLYPVMSESKRRGLVLRCGRSTSTIMFVRSEIKALARIRARAKRRQIREAFVQRVLERMFSKK